MARREWFTAVELAGLPELPTTERRVRERATREVWVSRARQGRGGGLQFHVSSLPPAAQAELEQRAQDESEDGTVQLLAMPEWKRKRAMLRSAVLNLVDEHCVAWKRSRSAAITVFEQLYNAGQLNVPPDVREQIPSVDERTLWRWFGLRDAKGVAGLADNYGNRAGTGLVDQRPELRDLLVGLLAKSPNIRPGQLLEYVRAAKPDLAEGITESRLHKWSRAWKQANPGLWMSLTNPDRYKSHYQVAFGKADGNIERLNQLWELDSTPADVMLKDGRHTVLGVIDIYSRRVKMLVSKSSKASAVAMLMRNALLAWGVPEGVRTDNGADYKSHHFTTTLLHLGIGQHFCQPFRSEEKPFIERAFKTFSHGLLELKPGFIGHSVAERKAIEARRAFAKRLFERDGTLEMSCTAAELQTFCDEWCENVYARRPHRRLGDRAPFDVARAWTAPVRRIEDPRAIDLLIADGDERTVSKSGIRIDGTTFIAAELGPLVNTRVYVRHDPSNMGRLWVFNDAGFVCEALCAEREGVDPAALAAQARSRQREAIREAKNDVRTKAKPLPEDLAEVIMAKARAEAAQVTALPHQGEAYTTPMLEAATDAVRSLEAARAAQPAQRDAAEPRPEVAARAAARHGRAVESSVDLAERQRTIAEFQELLAKKASGDQTDNERTREAVLRTLPEVKGWLRRQARGPVQQAPAPIALAR